MKTLDFVRGQWRLIAVLTVLGGATVARAQCGAQFEPCCTTGSQCNPPLECNGNTCELPIVVCAPGATCGPTDTPTETPTDTPTVTSTVTLTPTPTPTSTNAAPDCGAAVAVPNRLWPPNHKLVNITVGGVMDSDGDAVRVTITAVSQDEPIEGLGSGDTCPDSFGIGTAAVQVRAERDGTGDGRVYHLAFIATDAGGASCSGSVAVCVPHDQSGRPCVDEGPLFSSNGPC